MGLEDFEQTINYLKKAHEERDFRLHWIYSIINEHIFEPLQSNPEYQEIISFADTRAEIDRLESTR